MPGPTTGTAVAIFNSHAEFIDSLREALECEGLTSVTALLAEIQDGTLDLVAFLEDRKSTRLNSSHANISYAVFCLKKKKIRSPHWAGAHRRRRTISSTMP